MRNPWILVGASHSTRTSWTLAPVGPRRTPATNCSSALMSPSDTISTRPSGRLRAHPATPHRWACCRAKTLNPTPCTRPRTHRWQRAAVCVTFASRPSSTGRSRSRLELAGDRAQHSVHKLSRCFRPVPLGQSYGFVDYHADRRVEVLHLVDRHAQNSTIGTREAVYRPLGGKLREQGVDPVAFTPHALAQCVEERTFPPRNFGRHAINHGSHRLSTNVGFVEDPQG